MPTPWKLRKIEKQYGEPLETLIPRMISEHGTVFKAAVALKVYPNAIYNWQKKQAREGDERKASK